MHNTLTKQNKAMLSASESGMFFMSENAVRFFEYSFFYGYYYFARKRVEGQTALA